MKISPVQLKHLCEGRQLNIKQLLSRAGVSRNAYYSLVRKDSVLPRSVSAIAAQLGVSPAAFLEDAKTLEAHASQLLIDVDAICASHNRTDRDTIRHTLILLQEQPVDRLRRALIRGQQFNLRRKRDSVSKGTDKAKC
jgi:transcriptional regulator with XRE-family HTH domain